MDIVQSKNPIFEGETSWLYECLKNEAKEFPFDKPYCDSPSDCENEFLIYECLMFNRDREDSLFVMQNLSLFEYFSIDRSELLLKLIQYYENHVRYNFDKELVEGSLPVEKENKLTSSLVSRFKFDNKKHKDPERKFKAKVVGNILLEYSNGSHLWLYDFELKNVLFGLGNLPDSKHIKTLRIFPLKVRELKTKVITWINKDDQYLTESELKYMSVNSEKDDRRLTNFVRRLKALFYDKYLLNLIKLKLFVFELGGKSYVWKVEDFLFEKYENKHIKLVSEGLFLRYTQKYKDRTNMVKKSPSETRALHSFFRGMKDKYDELFSRFVSVRFLEWPKKEPESDQVFRILKPSSPFPLSYLMDPKVPLGTFTKFATYNLYKRDNVPPIILKSEKNSDTNRYNRV